MATLRLISGPPAGGRVCMCFSRWMTASSFTSIIFSKDLVTTKLELEVYNNELNTVNTDLYIRNKALETSIEYPHAIISAIRQPLIILQNDGRVRTANNAFYGYFGLDPEEVKGQYLYTIG